MKPALERRLVLAATTLGLMVSTGWLGSAAGQPVRERAAGTVDARLAGVLAAAAPDQKVPAIVVLRAQLSPGDVQGTGRRARLHSLVTGLQSVASAEQAGLRTYLKGQVRAGNVSDVQPLWITDSVSLRATPAVLEDIAKRAEVKAVQPDRVVLAPASSGATASPVHAAAGPTTATYSTAEPNVSQVGAPAMWDQGFQGQGVVVASMDTGVDVTHPDLAARWRGGSDSWYDPHGQHSTPTDVNGHGTQTMGVILGGDAGGTSVGIAPQARWIAVKLFDDRGSATATDIHLGYQWLLDPDHDPSTPDAPNVVNNSWTLSPGSCVLDFQSDLRALRMAGILPVFAAGNYGPASSTVASPADNPEAVAVGGVDAADVVDGSSSRGPSTCTGATQPTLTAPDTGVRTTDLYGGYVADTGTSIAAPHVTGAVALLLSALPSMASSADTQEDALLHGVRDLGDPGLDAVYGYGRLDVAAAYQWAASTRDFGLSISPGSAGTTAGGSASFTVTSTPVGGFADPVTLSASGLPPGVTATFDLTTLPSGSGSAQLSLSTSASLPPGSYPFQVQGTSGTTTHTSAATLVVTAPPDFSLGVSPASRTANAGTSTTYAVTVTPLNGFNGVPTLAVSGLPGSVGTWRATSPGSGTATVTVTTLTSAPAGSYPLTITATSGSLVHSVGVTLTVPVRDFRLTASPLTASVTRGGTATFTVATKALGGFTGAVSMAVAGVPGGTTTTWTPNPVVVPNSTKLQVRTTTATPRGTYTLTLTGSSGGLSHQVTVSLTVR